MTLFKENVRPSQVIVSWCLECGSTHEFKVETSGQLNEVTMLHQEWCSMDLRNIRHRVWGMRP
jgi:hypothetical protein